MPETMPETVNEKLGDLSYILSDGYKWLEYLKKKLNQETLRRKKLSKSSTNHTVYSNF